MYSHYSSWALQVSLFSLLLAAILPTLVTCQNATTARPLPSVRQVCEEWSNLDDTIYLAGMGQVRGHFYLSDSRFNLVRVNAQAFSFSGEGNQTRASLDLSHPSGAVFDISPLFWFKGDRTRDDFVRWMVSTFFVQAIAEDHPLFPVDTLAFFRNISYPIGTNLTLVPLVDFGRRPLTWKVLKVSFRRPEYQVDNPPRMLSSGTAPVGFYRGERVDWINFHSYRPLKPQIWLAVNKSVPLSGDLQRHRFDYTSGIYLPEGNRFLLLGTQREIGVFTGNHSDVSIPYRDFFRCYRNASEDGDLEGSNLLSIISIAGGLLALLLALCCCICLLCGGFKKRKGGSSRLRGRSKTTSKKVGGKGGKGSSSSLGPAGGKSSSAATSDSSLITTSKAQSTTGTTGTAASGIKSSIKPAASVTAKQP